MTPQLALAKGSREQNTKRHNFLGSKLARFRISAAQTAESAVRNNRNSLQEPDFHLAVVSSF